jgi:hypothetical protein
LDLPRNAVREEKLNRCEVVEDHIFDATRFRVHLLMARANLRKEMVEMALSNQMVSERFVSAVIKFFSCGTALKGSR